MMTPMNADYLDAHERHLDDAERLRDAERWANADHLYGVAAECGLKRLMLAFGMPFDRDKDLPKAQKDKKHADAIWARYETYRSGHPQGAGYGLPAVNPFNDWDVSQRYVSQNLFDRHWVEPHRTGAEAVNRLVIKGLVEGLI